MGILIASRLGTQLQLSGGIRIITLRSFLGHHEPLLGIVCGTLRIKEIILRINVIAILRGAFILLIQLLSILLVIAGRVGSDYPDVRGRQCVVVPRGVHWRQPWESVSRVFLIKEITVVYLVFIVSILAPVSVTLFVFPQ